MDSAKSVKTEGSQSARVPQTPRSRSTHPDRHAQVDDLFPYDDRWERECEDTQEIERHLRYLGVALYTE